MIYPNRYENEPNKRKAYQDAYDCIVIYGIPRRNWNYKKFGLDRIEMKEVWATAEKDAQGKSMLCCVY